MRRTQVARVAAAVLALTLGGCSARLHNVSSAELAKVMRSLDSGRKGREE